MADQFTTVTSRNWFQNIANSFGGVVVGILLFLGSFYVLWTNEGRVDMSKVVLKESIPLSITAVDKSADGKFVSLTGQMVTAQKLGDAPRLAYGSYLSLDRISEMYAWEEDEKSETKDKIGGGSETTTTYTYKKEWTSSPKESSSFKYPADHTNPPMALKSKTWTVSAAQIGAYKIDPTEMELPGGQRVEQDYRFIGRGSLENPLIGDLRVSYRALPSGAKLTAFGKLSGSELTPYYYKNKDRFFRALSGTLDEAVSQLAGEYKMWLWIMRLVGFLMMWFGICLFFGPLTEVLDVLPFLGKVGRGMVAVVAFPLAFVLSLVTIIVSIIAHNIWVLVVVLALIAGGLFYSKRMKK